MHVCLTLLNMNHHSKLHQKTMHIIVIKVGSTYFISYNFQSSINRELTTPGENFYNLVNFCYVWLRYSQFFKRFVGDSLGSINLDPAPLILVIF